MAPERRFLPLLLLSLPALFLFSHYHSSLRVPTPTAPTFSFIASNRNPNPKPDPHSYNFTFTVKVLAFERIASLTRCLRSLAKADYLGDRVNLHVYIDHFGHEGSEGDGAILDKKLENSLGILNFVDGFSWDYGDKMVHYRTGNAGLQAQWLEAWWPSSDNEFAFVVEDDLEVSPLYYKFLRELINYYYYNTSNFSPSIYGASLQRPRFVPGKHGNKMQLSNETRLFLYQLVGTWGQLLFPKPWKEFRLWYDIHKAKGIKPLLQGMVTTGWYNKMGDKIWTPWFVKFIHSRGYFNIYTNFLQERALSVSHRDAGVNYGKTAGPDSYLIDERSIDFDLQEMHPLSNLKWYDFCFREVRPQNIIQSFAELESALYTFQKQRTIIFLSLFKASEAVTKNLLCHFEKLNLDNYVLVGPKSGFLLDLARRGHLAIDLDPLLGNILNSKLPGFRKGNVESVKEITVKAYLIKWCLESGFHSWVIDANMALVGRDPFSDFNIPNYDFYAVEAAGFFFSRSSSYSLKIWTEDFIDKAAATASAATDSLYTKERGFVYIVRNLLEQKKARIKRVDQRSFGMKIDTAGINQTTSLGKKDKLVFWELNSNTSSIQKCLEELGLWIIDGESCVAVVCHQS